MEHVLVLGTTEGHHLGIVLAWCQRVILPYFSDLSIPLLMSTCVSTGSHGIVLPRSLDEEAS